MTLPWPVPSLLPHGGPMVLIGEPASSDGTWAEASVRIGEDSLFFTPGLGVPSWVGTEYMAQTIALYAGVGRRREGKDIQIGLLIGCRRYEVETAYFPLGSLLNIQVEETWRDDQMAVFECTITESGAKPDTAPLAKAQINVFSPADVAAFLAGERS